MPPVWENAGDIKLTGIDGEAFWLLSNVLSRYPRENMEPLIYSPWFKLVGTKWRLSLIFENVLKSYGHFGLFLQKKDLAEMNSSFHIKLGIKNHETDAFEFFEGDLDRFGRFGNWEVLSEYYSTKTRYSPRGYLIFLCDIKRKENSVDGPLSESISVPSIDEIGEVNGENEDPDDVSNIKGVNRLLLNLKNMLKLDLHSDAVLIVGQQEFPVHRGILAARSPVFASTFQHNTSERTSGKVHIADCSTESIEILLQYLYYGNADAMSSDNVFDLYYAADKYQVLDLKEECVNYLINNLTVEVFCDVIELSLRHCETELCQIATRFFCENISQIVRTVQWQEFLSRNPTAANELIIQYVPQQ